LQSGLITRATAMNWSLRGGNLDEPSPEYYSYFRQGG